MKKMSRLILMVSCALLLVLLSCSVHQIQAQKSKCNAAKEKEADENVGRIMTFGTDRPFPTNKAELKEYCKESTRLVAKVENYKTTCLKDQAKTIVSVIIYSIKNVISSYCKHPNSKRTAELLDSAVCANAASNDYNKCSIEYIQRLIYSKTLKLSKERLLQTCCGYFQIYNCVRDQASKHPECTENRVEANIDFIKAFFDNAINAGCGEHNGDSDKCDRSVIPPPKKTKKALPKSFFKPLVNILSNL